MIEKLLSYALLLNSGLMTVKKYEEYLNNEFLKNPDDDLLLELQFLTSDLHSTVRLIFEECYNNEMDKDIFGEVLLQELKETYYLKSLPMKEFGQRAYLLWKDIPYSISSEEPFHTLSYADDPLSWGDIEQTCKIYEDLFEYYANGGGK